MKSENKAHETDTFSLLKELSETPGVSGQEDRIRARVSDHLAPLVDELQTDTLGNLTGLKRGHSSSARRVMLAAHMDEIGLIITQTGTAVFFASPPVGGVDLAVIARPGGHRPRPALICPGLIASRPPHVLSPWKSARSPLRRKQLFIDVGSARRRGSPSTVSPSETSSRSAAAPNSMAKGRATGKALGQPRLDRRSAGRAFRLLQSRSPHLGSCCRCDHRAGGDRPARR